MKMFEATEAFSSLAQETRLKVFKLLVEYGGDGVIPGKIAERLKIPDNTLSFHLSLFRISEVPEPDYACLYRKPPHSR